MRIIQLVFTVALVTLLPVDAWANKVKRLRVTAPNGFDRAPELTVYSVDGEKYSDVDGVATTEVSVNLWAECRYEGRGNKAYKGTLKVPGMARLGTKQPANFLIPHSDEASGLFRWDGGEGQQFDPVKACNDELDKRVATSGKSRYELMAKGFTFNYGAGLRAQYDFRCKAIGLGRTDLEAKGVNVNTRVKCMASPAAAKKLPDAPPKPIRAKPARLQPVLRAASFEAEPEVHTGDCPATIKFNGTLTANRAGTVEYRYTKYDGTQSPVYKLAFDKAGTKKTRAWQTNYSKPNAATTLSSGGGKEANADDFQGWYRLDILSPEPTGQVAAHYRVMCGADAEEAPATIQAVPAQRQPVEVKQMQMQKLEAVPARRKVEPVDKRD